MRLRWLAALAVVALVLPTALAGTERDPEITDPADQEWTPTDLLAAWFQVEDEGVRFFIKTTDGSMPRQYPDHVYWVSFKVAGRSVGATVGFGNDGVMRGHLGALNGPAWDRGGFERVANNGVVGLRSHLDRPAIWSGVVPWDAVPGLEEGATLTDLAAGTAFYDRQARSWRGGLDVATSTRTFVAKDPSLFPIIVPPWVLPTIVVGCTLAGMAGGLALARRAPTSKTNPTPVPMRSDLAPPAGQRFQRAPPTQGKR